MSRKDGEERLELNEQLGRLENYGSHLAQQNDRLLARLEEVAGELRALIDRSWLELRAGGEALDAALERLDELDRRLALLEQRSARDPGS